MIGKTSRFSILAASVTAVAVAGGVYLRMDRTPADPAPVQVSQNVASDAADTDASPAQPQLAEVSEAQTAPTLDDLQVANAAPAKRPSFNAATLSRPELTDTGPQESADAELQQSLEAQRSPQGADVEVETTAPALAQAQPEDIDFAQLPAPSTSPQAASRVGDNPCEVVAQANPEPAAQVRLFLRAACHVGSRVDISHAGLTFSDRVMDDGTLALIVPAFEERARFTFVLADGTAREVLAYVPDMASVGRSGVSWQGEAALDLTARMPQGTYWAANPGTLLEARMFGGGYLTQLGDPSGHRALIFSVINPDTSFVPLELFAGRCPEGLELATARSITESAAQVSHHRITQGFCTQNGTTLQLKNTVKHLRMARN